MNADIESHIATLRTATPLGRLNHPEVRVVLAKMVALGWTPPANLAAPVAPSTAPPDVMLRTYEAVGNAADVS